jgi:hypothetical protein
MATFVGNKRLYSKPKYKMYSDFEEAFIQTVDKHAPVKQKKKRCQNPASFINKELRKAVYKIYFNFDCYYVFVQ